MRVLRESELDGLTKEIISKLGDSGIILLRGDLASGKTTFVKSFVKNLGLNCEVSSPTFSILNEYENRVCHYDIYQNGLEGFLQSGLLEKLDEPKYHLVEWGDERLEEVLKSYGFEFIVVEIEKLGDKRGYSCTNLK